MTTAQFLELLKTLAEFAWPLLAAIVFLTLLPTIREFVSREKFTIKVGGMEVSTEQATKNLTALVSDLQEKVAQIEKIIADKLSVETSADPLMELPVRRGDKPRILWVDDVPSNIAIQVQKLMGDGYWIDIASTTAQAISMFELTKFDLVISDMGRAEDGVPRPYAGIALAREIRQRNASIPIVIFTSRRDLSAFRDRVVSGEVTRITNSTVELYRIVDALIGQTSHAN
jgi:CheY-like chemotaxis protein